MFAAQPGDYNRQVRASIIIPTLNESSTIENLIARLGALEGDFEIVIADGGSSDGTVDKARRLGLRVIEAPRGRGSQMNAGARASSGEILVFLHADTSLPPEALRSIDRALGSESVSGGNFSLAFDGESRAAGFLTRIYPLLRMLGMCYGDSAIFTRRERFDALGGYRDYPIFEDVDFYRRLRRAGRFVHLDDRAVTSSRRFEGRFIRTFALWSAMTILYWVGVGPERINRLYRPIR